MPESEGKGWLIGVGIVAVLGVLAGVLMLAGRAKGAVSKIKTHFENIFAGWFSNSQITYWWEGYLKDENGKGINGKTIKVQVKGTVGDWITIGQGTTYQRAPGYDGYYLLKPTYPKPVMPCSRIIFEGDSQYEGCSKAWTGCE
jgi:hypothetical protein